MPRRKVLLATHLEPVIHGQALIAGHLSRCAEDWTELDLSAMNLAYAETREALGGVSFKKISRAWHFAKALAARIREEKVETLILTPGFFKGAFIKDFLTIRYLKRVCDVRIIAWVHMDPSRLGFENLPAPAQSWVRRSLERVDHWVACAPSLLRAWPDWLQEVTRGTRSAVPNGIEDLSDSVPELEKAEGLTLSFLSAMDPEKGFIELLEVAQGLVKEREGLRFDFYGGPGGGETDASLKTRFAELDSPDLIQWHGPVWGEEKAIALSRSDIFVFPSHTEQFPLAVLDAMASSLPVVATQVGGLVDALPAEELIPPRDKVALKRRLLDLIDDAELRQREAQRNRLKFEAEFSLPAFSKAWRHLLSQ